MNWDTIVKEFISLWVVIDPIGSIPVFIAVTASLQASMHKKIALKACAFAAAKGLPGSAPDLSAGRIAVFSRYFHNKSVNTNCFFFEFPTPQDGKAWLSSFQINREWALRHSCCCAKFVARSSAACLID